MFRSKKSGPRPAIFSYYDDESSRGTEFRRLARNVRRRGNPSEVRSILVTSAAKHEGKSLIAANLAIAIAKRESNKKVLLMDYDLRKPIIHTLFDVSKTPGVNSLLAGDMGPEDVARDTELENLKVIPSGQYIDSPTQLLGNAEGALEKCKQQYDVLICDAPPVVPVDDAAMLAPHVDGVLVVVLAGKTDRVVVKRAIDILADAHAKILGIALNNMHGTLPYHYDYRYYHYKYDKQDIQNNDSQ